MFFNKMFLWNCFDYFWLHIHFCRSYHIVKMVDKSSRDIMALWNALLIAVLIGVVCFRLLYQVCLYWEQWRKFRTIASSYRCLMVWRVVSPSLTSVMPTHDSCNSSRRIMTNRWRRWGKKSRENYCLRSLWLPQYPELTRSPTEFLLFYS